MTNFDMNMTDLGLSLENFETDFNENKTDSEQIFKEFDRNFTDLGHMALNFTLENTTAMTEMTGNDTGEFNEEKITPSVMVLGIGTVLLVIGMILQLLIISYEISMDPMKRSVTNQVVNF